MQNQYIESETYMYTYILKKTCIIAILFNKSFSQKGVIDMEERWESIMHSES